MKIAAHITFYYDKKRFIYLKEVISKLLALEQKVDIFIYTNYEFNLFPEFKNVKYLIYQYTNKGFRFSYKSIFNKLGFKKMLHPFYLTWESRKIIEEKVEEYDVQIYLEDDMKFTKGNLEYWLKYSHALIKQDYNLGFLRFEFNKEDKFITDLIKPLKETITINNIKYLINDANPYCGFWIYSKKELKAFIKTKIWRFKYNKYGKRERAAIGWHGEGMNRYKKTLIPLVEINNNHTTPIGSGIHHLPNNYIHHELFCTVKFPIAIPKNE